MLTIYRVDHRYRYGNKPHETATHEVGYYTTLDKARATVKDFLGENAKDNSDFGFDEWTSPDLPHTTYLISAIKVY